MRRIFKYFLVLAVLMGVFSGCSVYYQNGTSVVCAATSQGFKTVNGKTYYYYKDGSKAKGFKKIDGSYYLFDSKTGVMKTGFQKYDGKCYYFSKKNGKALKGFIDTGSARYYANSYGVLQSGKKTITSGTHAGTYLFDETSKKSLTGVRTYKGNKYYFSAKTGKMLKGFISTGTAKYYAGTNGILKKGMLTVESGDKAGRYLFDSTSCKMLTGFQTYGSNRYYFSTKTGKAMKGFFTVSGSTYYADPEKAYLRKGIVTIESGTREGKYHFDTTTFKMLKGLQKYNDYTYFYDRETGKRLYGWVNDGIKRYYMNQAYGGTPAHGLATIDGKKYFFDSRTYEEQFGIVSYEYDGKTVTNYFDTTTGERKTGVIAVDGKRYYFDPKSGSLQKGYCLTADRSPDGKNYFLDPVTGEFAKGVFEVTNQTTGEPYWKFFDPEGEKGFGATGLQEINGRLYFIHPTYNYAVFGLYYVKDEFAGDRSAGLYYFSQEDDEYPGSALANVSLTIGGHVTFETGDDYTASWLILDDSDPSKMFSFGLNHLGLPYGAPTDGLDGELTTLRCNSFAALCCRQVSEEIFDKLAMASHADAYKPYNMAGICEGEMYEENGKYSYDINDAQPGDLLFWNRDSCGNKPLTCDYHTTDRNGKDLHIHHVSVYMGLGTDGYHYNLEETEVDGTYCVRIARIRTFNVYSLGSAPSDYYIAAIGKINNEPVIEGSSVPEYDEMIMEEETAIAEEYAEDEIISEEPETEEGISVISEEDFIISDEEITEIPE